MCFEAVSQLVNTTMAMDGGTDSSPRPNDSKENCRYPAPRPLFGPLVVVLG